jgi:site-specific recombinase XerD
MAETEINQFITYLVTERKVSASTQNQAISAILFLYRHVLHVELDETRLAEFRPQRAKVIPTVLSKEEVKRIIDLMQGTNKLIVQVLYGSGLRIMECLRLRVKDLDFANHQIVVRDGKGGGDRVTPCPTRSFNRWNFKYNTPKPCTIKTWRRGTALCICHTPSNKNLPTPIRNGPGNTSSQRQT